MSRTVIALLITGLVTGCTATQVRSGYTPAATTTPVPAASGPATSMGDGKYEVGVDIAAGKYKTPGHDPEAWGWCSYERTTPDGDFIDWEVGDGPQVVVVKAGEFFESSDCGTWTLQ